MKSDRMVWSHVFFKTYFEERSIFHLFVNFNSSTSLQHRLQPPNAYKVQGKNSPAMGVCCQLPLSLNFLRRCRRPPSWNHTFLHRRQIRSQLTMKSLKTPYFGHLVTHQTLSPVVLAWQGVGNGCCSPSPSTEPWYEHDRNHVNLVPHPKDCPLYLSVSQRLLVRRYLLTKFTHLLSFVCSASLSGLLTVTAVIPF